MSETLLDAATIVAGLVVLVVGGELLVRGAVALAASMRISSVVIGLTVVAFGTSSPELAVNLQAAYAGNADVGVGNVVGSNIFNVLFILGISALVAPLLVHSQLIRRDVPLMILASVLLLALSLDGEVSRLDGSVLFVGLVVYVGWCILQSRRETPTVQSEFAKEFGPVTSGAKLVLVQIGLIGGGLVMLSLGSHWLVLGAVSVATRLGVSELIIGLTIVAVGTSLPEVVTSVVAAWRGERDIAVGNVVGSNLFNILCVLGLSSIFAPDGIAISPAALRFDIPVMIAVAVACLPIFFTGNVIARWEGALFFFYYLVYTAYLVLNATDHALGNTLRDVMIMFVIPLTTITLAVTTWRSFRQKN
ncbi:MAG TPA: calcium/sodium antiporter, partial [Pirellulaceae bacterium]|nr:calcium/sodium antiporter [Pirellulaceae bacterium]